jgi:hypothetical protein
MRVICSPVRRPRQKRWIQMAGATALRDFFFFFRYLSWKKMIGTSYFQVS